LEETGLAGPAKTPIPKLQAPKKHQAPSSKTQLCGVCPGICPCGLVV
jgi:hypothetical protein